MDLKRKALRSQMSARDLSLRYHLSTSCTFLAAMLILDMKSALLWATWAFTTLEPMLVPDRHCRLANFYLCFWDSASPTPWLAAQMQAIIQECGFRPSLQTPTTIQHPKLKIENQNPKSLIHSSSCCLLSFVWGHLPYAPTEWKKSGRKTRAGGGILDCAFWVLNCKELG